MCDTVSFHPNLCNTPVLQPLEQAIIEANKLTTALQNLKQKQSSPPIQNNTILQALEKLSNIFREKKNEKMLATFQG